MPVMAFHGNGLVSKLEILRGDHAEYRFDTRVAELSQNGDAVEATLTDGTNSTVRRLVFGPEEQFVKPLGGYNAWFTAPDTVGLDGWYLMYQASGLNASMRPLHDRRSPRLGWRFALNRSPTTGAIPTSNGHC
jgi:2-polyprenyl-6-methoxyphenol hydroxylase-like FAD-dependent oxidoreductase